MTNVLKDLITWPLGFRPPLRLELLLSLANWLYQFYLGSTKNPNELERKTRKRKGVSQLQGRKNT